MTKALSSTEFINKVNKITNDNYKLLSGYKNYQTNVILKHVRCGKKWCVRPGKVLSEGKRCPYCYYGGTNTCDKFNTKFKSLSDGHYTLLTPYRRVHEKVSIKHLDCGNIFYMEPNSFLAGKRCPRCFGNIRKTTKEFQDEVFSTTRGEYVLKSKYINSRTKVRIYHQECGLTYMVTPHDFVSGNRCPHCNQSKGEKLVENILVSHGIKFEIQKVFSDCGNKNQWLPFDFYLPDYNLLIEYDGEQHFKPVKYFGGYKKLIDQNRRDTIKNEYAINNGINIVRISYKINKDELDKELIEYIKLCSAESLKPKVKVMI